MIRSLIAIASALAVFALPGLADEKMPLELKLIAKKESIAWPYDLGPKEFEAKLKETIKNKETDLLPKPPTIDFVLKITNMGKEKTTIYVEGDPNTLTLTLKGPGVVTAKPGLAFTTDFRFPKAVVLEPGKSHEIAVKSLSDGFRRMSRYIYPTSPGEYTLSAAYQLSTSEGAKGPVLKSNEARLKVEEPK